MPRGARIAGWVYFPIHAVVLPLTGQADRTAVDVPPVMVGAPDRVMPVGSTSVIVSGAVVVLLATVIVNV